MPVNIDGEFEFESEAANDQELSNRTQDLLEYIFKKAD